MRIIRFMLLLLLLSLLAGCQKYWASPPAGQEFQPTEVVPPTKEVYPLPLTTEAPKPTWTPPIQPTPRPSLTPIQPTPYAPEEPLSSNFPTVVYAVQRPGQTVQLWTLRYEQGMLREELLLDLTEEVLEPQIGYGYAHLGGYWVSDLSASPDGVHVALTLRTWEGGGVFTLIVGIDGKIYLPLLPDGQGIGFLAWFADGERILLGGSGGYVWGVSAFDGTSFFPLPGHYTEDAVAVSQDEKVIFSARLGASLNVINPDGTGLAPLALSPLLQGNIRLCNLTLSPNGQLIAFTWDRKPRSSAWGEGQIWVMNASGTNQRPLNNEETLAFGLEWSPDSRTIAFVRHENPGAGTEFNPLALVSSLWLINVESGQEHQILPSEGQFAQWSPLWLPDDSGLLFLSNRGGDSNLWFIRPDGTGLQRLTHQGDLRWATILGK